MNNKELEQTTKVSKEELLKQVSDELNRAKFYFDTLCVVEQADPNSNMKMECIRMLVTSTNQLKIKTSMYEEVQ